MTLKIAPQRATGRVRITIDDQNGSYFKGQEYDVYNYGEGFFSVANSTNFGLIPKEHCVLIPMIVYKDMKFRINSPEHSEEVQTHLFNLGVCWSGISHPEVMYTQLPYIFIGPRGWLEYTDDEGVFNDLTAIEYELQKEITVKHVLVPVEQHKKVMIGDKEYDESVIMAALHAFQARK